MLHVPTLTGPRVRLREPVPDDAEALYTRVASDPEVTRYLSWKPHADVAETRRVITTLFNIGSEESWLIEADGEVVGLCGRRRPQAHEVELGYCLGRPWWRRGLMSEAMSVLIDDTERDPRVYRISAYCHVDNAGSAGVLRHCGLTLEGRSCGTACSPTSAMNPRMC